VNAICLELVDSPMARVLALILQAIGAGTQLLKRSLRVPRLDRSRQPDDAHREARQAETRHFADSIDTF
jgi:hypothetical protein